ncbi:MAG: hypothetical protein ACI8X5_003122 [Planctomycetota bacterium]
MVDGQLSAGEGGGRKRLIKAFLALISGVIGLGLAEGANRVRLSMKGKPYDAQVVRAELRREFETVDQLGLAGSDKSKQGGRVLHPYTGFDLLPGLRQVSHDIEFYKTPEADMGFEILLLGGSVANGFGRDSSVVFIDLLKQDERFVDREIRILRYGRASFKQPQQINSLIFLMSLGLRPDAVLNLDGFNEVAVANMNTKFDVHPLQPAVAQWSPSVVNLLDQEDTLDDLLDLRLLRLEVTKRAGQGLHSSFLWSSIVGNWWIGKVRAGRSQQIQQQEKLVTTFTKGQDNPVIRGPKWKGDVHDVMDLAVATWKQASISMDAICRRRGMFYQHVLQPTLHAAVSKVPTQAEIRLGKASSQWLDAVQHGYPLLIEAGRELDEEGVHFLDGTPVFNDVSGSIYIDACHYNPTGQHLLAGAIAEAFLQNYEEL